MAWGDGSSGQTSVPVELSNVVAIASGAFHSLALRADGSVVAWGDNHYGQSSVPRALTNVVGIAAGPLSSLALRADRTVAVWGTNSPDTAPPSDLNNVVAIAAGGFWGTHTLALRGDGSVVAWGDSPAATVPAGLTNVVAIAAGHQHGLVLKRNGKLVAWGMPFYVTNIPVGFSNGVAIAAGGEHCLALVGSGPPVVSQRQADRIVARRGGSVFFHCPAVGGRPLRYQWRCNGTNVSGASNAWLVLTDVRPTQAGLYTLTVSNAWGTATSPGAKLTVVPVFIIQHPRDAVAFLGGTATMEVHTEGIEPVSYQWSFEGSPLLGETNRTLVRSNVCAALAGRYSVTASNRFGVVSAEEARLAVNNVVAWGDNDAGQTMVPPGLSNAVSIAVGASHHIALRSDGLVVAWGTGAGTNVPNGLSNVVAIATGTLHGLALRGDGTIAAWGLSLGTKIPADLNNAVAIASGPFHSLAIRSNGTVVSWGNNQYGQTNTPVGLADVVAVAGGNGHSLAFRADGIVVAWGRNDYGQGVVPAMVTNVVAIAAGSYHNLALKADGSVVAWGQNTSGQTSVPAGVSNAIAVAAGSGHSLALLASGTIMAWGATNSAQVLIPEDLHDVTSIAAANAGNLALIADQDSPKAWLLPSPRVKSNSVIIKLPTDRGRLYLLERKLSLEDDQWTVVQRHAGDGKVKRLVEPVPGAGQGFYRARRMP